MKKLIVLMFLVMTSVGVMAQIEVKSIEVKANLRSDFGLGAGVTIGLFKDLEFVPSLNYFFEQNENVWTIDADFHYNFNVGHGFTVYPLLGIVINDVPDLGMNIGVGAKYSFNERVGAFVECKYQSINDCGDETFFSLGVNIKI